MALTFHPPENVIKDTVERLKQNHQIHPDAVFNAAAENGLRKEVAYRDQDLTYRMGQSPLEEQIIDTALELLKSESLIDPASRYNKHAFMELRQLIKTGFEKNWTSISPVMARLIYMLTSVRKPRNLVEIGSFWGYTLAWFAGPCIGVSPAFEAHRIYGIDIDERMVQQARRNFDKIPNSSMIQHVAGDARKVLEEIPGPIDFLYIEAKLDEVKGLYLILLKQVYDKLPYGAWVIAHDNLDYSFRDEIREYLEFVRDKSHFSESICFDIDECGMELSIK